jgi:hypothetical protein
MVYMLFVENILINKLGGEQKRQLSRVGFKNEDCLNIWSLFIPVCAISSNILSYEIRYLSQLEYIICSSFFPSRWWTMLL